MRHRDWWWVQMGRFAFQGQGEQLRWESELLLVSIAQLVVVYASQRSPLVHRIQVI